MKRLLTFILAMALALSGIPVHAGTLQDMAQEMETNRDEITALEEELENTQNELKTLEEQKEEIRSKVDACIKAKETLENSLEEACQEKEDLPIESLTEEVEALSQAIEALDGEIAELQEERRNTTRERRTKDTNYRSYQNALKKHKANLDAFEASMQEKLSELEALGEKRDTYHQELIKNQEELEKYTENLNKAEEELEKAENTLKALRPDYEAAHAVANQGSYGYYQAKGSKSGTNALTYCRYASYIHFDEEVDGTALQNMEESFAYLEQFNELRRSLGLPECRVSDEMMASAQADADYSDQNLGHALQFFVGENVAWNRGDRNPYTQWYDKEKAVFDKAVKALGQTKELEGREAYEFFKAHMEEIENYVMENYPNDSVGHYTNIINPNYEATGFAICTRGSMNQWNTYVQTFTQRTNDTQIDMSEEKASFLNYWTPIKETLQAYKDAQEQISHQSQEIDDWKNMVDIWKDSVIPYAQNFYQGLCNDYDAKLAEIAEVQTQIDTVQGYYQECEDIVESLAAEIEELKAKLAAMEEEYFAKKETLTGYQEEHAAKQTALKELTARKAALEEEIAGLEAEIAERQEELRSYEEESQSLENRIAEKTETIESLQESLEEKREELARLEETFAQEQERANQQAVDDFIEILNGEPTRQELLHAYETLSEEQKALLTPEVLESYETRLASLPETGNEGQGTGSEDGQGTEINPGTDDECQGTEVNPGTGSEGQGTGEEGQGTEPGTGEEGQGTEVHPGVNPETGSQSGKEEPGGTEQSGTGQPETGQSGTGQPSIGGQETGQTEIEPVHHDQPSKKIPVKKITLKGFRKIAVGRSVELVVTYSPKNAVNKKVKWTVSDKRIASVSKKGVVKIKKAGKKVTVTAVTSNGKKAKITLLGMKGRVTSVKVSGKNRMKKSLKLKALVKSTKNANRKLEWTSSNKKWAVVTRSGKVTAKKAGKGHTVMITASATDGTGKKAIKKIKIQ